MSNRILYIQHAPRVGGSVISLKELVTDAIQHGFDCSVICVNTEVADFYRSIGARTAIAPIAVFNHNSALHYKLKWAHVTHVFKQSIKFFYSFYPFLKLINKTKPDIVHLNSSTLIPYLFFFRLLRIKSVVHIREYIVKGHWGVRRSVLRFLLNAFANKIIYISEVELENLKTKKAKSVVVYNYVHAKDFTSLKLKSNKVEEKFRLLTLGGLYKIKGGDVLLESLKHLDNGFELLIAGSEDPRRNPFDLAKTEGQDYFNKIISLLNDEQVSAKVNFLGRTSSPGTCFAKADALIFWAGSPHFPRPVFEGWLMKCHIIYFNPGFTNNYINDETVNVVKGFDSLELKKAIEEVSSNSERLLCKVENGNRIANQSFTEQNFAVILNCYHQLLK